MSRRRRAGRLGGRLGRVMKPPEGEPWAWLTRELLESDAWRDLTINARRFIDFLLVEHMNHAGTENGNLRATYGQLQAFGLPRRHIAAAIDTAERLGLVDCFRGGLRIATTYTLTFYSVRGAPATNQWKRYRRGLPMADGDDTKNRNDAPPSDGRQAPERMAEKPNLPPEGMADATPRRGAPSISWTGSDGVAKSSHAPASPPPPCPKPVANAAAVPRGAG